MPERCSSALRVAVLPLTDLLGLVSRASTITRPWLQYLFVALMKPFAALG